MTQGRVFCGRRLALRPATVRGKRRGQLDRCRRPLPPRPDRHALRSPSPRRRPSSPAACARAAPGWRVTSRVTRPSRARAIEDWVELAARELAALRAEHAKVFVVGVSMGGLVALRLAADPRGRRNRRDRDAARVEAAASPARPSRCAADSVSGEARLRTSGSGGPGAPSGAAGDARSPRCASSSGSRRVVAGRARAHSQRRSSSPMAATTGRRRRGMQPGSMPRSRSREKELFYLERSGHVASVDYDGPALALAAADFIARRC